MTYDSLRRKCRFLDSKEAPEILFYAYVIMYREYILSYSFLVIIEYIR